MKTVYIIGPTLEQAKAYAQAHNHTYPKAAIINDAKAIRGLQRPNIILLPSTNTRPDYNDIIANLKAKKASITHVQP